MQTYEKQNDVTDKNLSTHEDFKSRISRPWDTFTHFFKKKQSMVHNRLHKSEFDLKQKKGSTKKGKGWKFSKQKRFLLPKSSFRDICYLDIPVSLTQKSCIFSNKSGERYPISKTTLKKAHDNPSPDKYSTCTQLNRGRSFSQAQSDIYRYIPHRKDVYSYHFSEHPGHIYDIRQNLDTRLISIKKRLKMYTEQQSSLYHHVPGPCYNIDDKKLRNIGGVQKGATQQTGNRMDLSLPLNVNPGPQYRIEGFCDKFKKVKLKLQKRLKVK